MICSNLSRRTFVSLKVSCRHDGAVSAYSARAAFVPEIRYPVPQRCSRHCYSNPQRVLIFSNGIWQRQLSHSVPCDLGQRGCDPVGAQVNIFAFR
jgi:hypothetical protein